MHQQTLKISKYLKTLLMEFFWRKKNLKKKYRFEDYQTITKLLFILLLGVL